MKPCETRDKLINTAIELMWTESYSSAGVEEICRRAGLNKGSFYHFFPSKMDLALAAFESHWESFRPELEQIFSSDTAPLERLSAYCARARMRQKELKKRFGFVPGCPLTSVGSEQGTQSEPLRKMVCRIFNQLRGYFESAIRDAMAEGSIPEADAAKRTDELFSYYLGVQIRARITNDLAAMEDMEQVFLTLLGNQKAIHHESRTS